MLKKLAIIAIGFSVVIPPVGASADPAQPGNTESIVETIEPSNDGVRVDIVGGDAFVRVRVERGHSLAMQGYYGEPYLQIDRDGTVLVNERAETFRISQTRYGTEVLPGGETVEQADVDWRIVSRNGTYLWHDHRVHWMSPQAPKPLDDRGLVQQWSIPVTIDGVSTIVSGSLYLRDAPGSWWWLLVVPTLLGGFVAKRVRVVAMLSVAGAVCAVAGAYMFWGLPQEARGAPAMFALGLFAFVVAISTAVFRTRHEVVDALIASAAVSLVIAIAIERDVVMNRFVPGVGDSVPLRLVLPLVVGFAIGVGVHSVKRLLAKPTEVASR